MVGEESFMEDAVSPAQQPLDFASLFRDHHARIYRYILYRVGDATEAEDLTSEVFERAFRYRATFNPALASFSTWITEIANNWVNNYLLSQERRKRNETTLTSDTAIEALPASEPPPEAQLLRHELLKRLFECIDLLKPRPRQVVALRFGSEMRNKEIAGLLDIKEHTISVILLRALQNLRECQEGA
jgi:RNA polymerase sigma factor (sigma-70 family)